MNSSLLAAYSVIALLVALHTIVRMAIGGPHAPVDRDPVDRGILLITALAASAAWGVLLPFYVTGWVGSPGGRSLRARVLRVPRLRPEPIFRERLYRAGR
jgi:hypothetical protein